MSTKKIIKEKSRILFNQRGVTNVSLRDVGKELNRSYGNLTYHYPTKEDLVLEIYKEMNVELTDLQSPSAYENMLMYFLTLPLISYEISLKYLFFTVDFVEIKRNFPRVYSKMVMSQDKRKQMWLQLLKKLHADGFLIDSLIEDDLMYLMFLSGSIRSSYFQLLPTSQYNKIEFSKTVNRLLKNYLSRKGLKVYDDLDSML